MSINELKKSDGVRDLSKIIVFAIILVLVIFTFYSNNPFGRVNDSSVRENQSNFFQEIKVIKAKNSDLENEINTLEKSLDEITNRDKALAAIQNETLKYRKLSGESSIFGSGILVTISDTISTQWMTDLVNELFTYGAEAISINDIRLVNKTIGFDTLPKGQIYLNGVILSPPFSIKIIGDGSNIMNFLNSSGNILSRLNSAYPNIKIVIDRKDLIHIK